MTRDQAEQARAAIEERHNETAGLERESEDMALSGFTERYMASREGTVGEGTQWLDRYTLKALVESMPASIRLRDVTPSMILDWQIQLKRTGITDVTVHGHMRRARAMFKDAVARRLIRSSPMDGVRAPLPKPVHFTPDLSNDDMMKLVDACRTDDWRCLVALCAFAGLRRNEAIRMSWADVQWSVGDNLAGRLTVQLRDNKVTTKSKRREVYLEPMLERVLLDVYSRRDPGRGDNILERMPASMHRTMSGYDDKVAGKRYTGIIERAGFVPWSHPFQALRRRREDIWIEVDGRDESVVLKWMGHSKAVSRSNYRTVSSRHYSLVSPTAEKDREIAALRAKIDALTEGGEA